MTTAGDARAPDEGRGVGKQFHATEELQNICQAAEKNSTSGVSELSTDKGGNIASICATIGISELEQILKHKTFTRAERQRLIALLQSEESPFNDTRDGAMSSLSRLVASTTSGSHKKHKLGHERDNFHASVIISKEVIVSPAELAKASYKGGTSTTDKAQGQDLKLINKSSASLSKTLVHSTQHPTTMENLPEELLLNIFIRLFSKQLSQMRSVSKSWNALLSQSSFIKSHLNHSIHNNNQILLVFHDDDQDPPDFKPVTTHLCQSPHLQLPNFIKLPADPSPRPGYLSDFTVVGCINGLICSSYGDSVIQIWNPSLSTVLTLPPYSMPCSDNSLEINFRFGFDPKKDDYKVVKITGLTTSPRYGIKWWLQIEIYSMRNGTWEFITQRFPSHIRSIDHHDYVRADGHDGHLHWIGYINEKSDSERIVAFDLGSETFREMLLPNSILNNNCNNQLGVLDKKVCVFSVGFHAFEIWVMEEYGVAESWGKRLVFSQYMDIGSKCPFGFTSRNDFLVVINDRLVLYDPTAKKETIFDHYGPTLHDPINIVEYVDSLVWVPPARREMVDGARQN